MGETRKRLDRLEEALEASEDKRRKLKKRVKRLERALADLEESFEAALEDDDEDDEDSDDTESEDADSIAPSGHRELSRPDETWTVARLREAATSRGLTGVSRMSKARLLEALAGTS